MDNDNTTAHKNDFALICDYFSNVERQGPGSDESTLLALDIIQRHARKEILDIADFGCGTGSATLLLAKHTDAYITPLDLSPEFIDKLRERAEAQELDEWMTPFVGDMAELPFAEGVFDVIWSEGAIYNIGFEKGLKEWRRHLKDDGFVAVTELSWLTDERPAEIERFWSETYPGMDTVAHKVEQMQRCGYRPIAAFTLPEDCWTTNYYLPQCKAQEDFMKRHPGDADARMLVDGQRQEAALYARYKAYYGYVFYIGQKI